MEKCNHSYVGPFSETIRNHVLLKQAVGYKYETEARHLYRFSVFTATKYPDATELSKEIILDWCSKKEYEAQANQCTRASILRQLALYMDSIGMNCYIIPKNYYPVEEQYVPHIFTEEELRHFFRETDRCHYVSECPYRHLIMPLFYRMIYSCGLRSSETRLLKVDDVDLENGILTIQHSKKDNSRLVPMSEDLTERSRRYHEQVNSMTIGNEYFFPGLNGNPMTITNVYHNFRRFLWKAGISHGGRGEGPRIYDFRHTYACHCLKNWVMQGKDLNVFLPILKTYMGHFSFDDTAYYLRLTADIYPDITIRLEGRYPDIIPRTEGVANETD